MSNFETPWTGACQAPLSMGFSRQEDCSGLLFPSPGDHPDPGIEPTSPALADRCFTTEPPGKSLIVDYSSPNGLRAIAECVSSVQTVCKGTEHLKLPVHVKLIHKYFSCLLPRDPAQPCTYPRVLLEKSVGDRPRSGGNIDWVGRLQSNETTA